MNPFIVLPALLITTLHVFSAPWAMELESPSRPGKSAVQTSADGNEGDVLATHTLHYPATSLTPEPTYPYTQSVVHDPRKVNFYKDNFRDLRSIEHAVETPEDVNVIIQSGRKDITYFGMGQYHLADDREGFLYTDALRDCIAIIAFDPGTGKSCLYHASKMEIRPNNFNTRHIETDFIPKFKHHFDGTTPQVSLVSSTFSQDLLELRNLLSRYDIPVHRIDVPDIVMEYSETRGTSGEYVSASNIIYVNKDILLPLTLQNVISHVAIPNTSVIVSKANGDIGISRQ